MYNGIGLTTPRGSGTNGFVIRNLSAVRKTKEKIRDYKEKEDLAVRPFDIELIEHERRRQAEVRCLELQELLEEKNIPEDEIQEKVNAFRAKLLAEKKSGPRDISGRPIVRDSHELAMAQEEKNEKAKSAFGISDDFVPGSSYDRNRTDKDKTLTPVPTLETAKSDAKPAEEVKVAKEKLKKKKKSHKRRGSSPSSSSSSEDESSRRKRRRKEKKKKSKKSHSHQHHKRKNKSSSHEKYRSSVECACVATLSPSSTSCHTNSCFNHNSSSEDCSDIPTEIQISNSSCVAIVDLATSSNSAIRDGLKSNSKSPIEIISLPLKFSSSSNITKCLSHSPPASLNPKCSASSVIPVTTATLVLNELRTNFNSEQTRIFDFSRSNSRSRSSSSERSKSNSRSPSGSKSKSRSFSPKWNSKSNSRSHTRSRTRSRTRSHSRESFSNSSSNSGSGRSRSNSRSNSESRGRKTRDRSRSSPNSNRGRSSRSHSKSRSHSASSKSSRSLSIPRRRGSPSFLDRRRITSARKRPIPYKRRQGSEWENSSDSSDSSD